MAAPVNANINILVNTSQAVAQLRNLQAQVASSNRAIGAGGGAAAAQQAALSKALMDGANASRMWNARIVPMTTATQQFTDSLDRGRMSLGQYTRHAASQLPGMSRIFKREFQMMTDVATENVRKMQTQYVSLGNSATGAAQAMALTPTALNKQAAATQVAAQRQMMMNQMIDLGSTKLLNWGKNTQWAGRQLMVGFSIPLAMMGAAAAKAFKEIDKAEISFKRVYGNLETTTAEMERNLEAVKELGEEYTKYGKSMASTIDIAARVAATGAQGDALVAGTEQTIRLATLGLMEYDEALDATISLQTAFKISNEDLASTIDFLNAVENETILTMQDMAAAIPRVAPVIKGLGGDVQDLAVLMTALREGGVSAEQGANAIKSGLGRLINPTKAAREEMAKYSISIDAIAQQNKGDLMGMLTDFSQALSNLGDFEQQQVLQKVFGTYQYARLGALFKNLANDSGQAARAIELTSMSVEDLARISDKELSKIEEATSVKFQAAVEQMKVAIAPIGEQFLKILTPVIDIITTIADKFNNLPDNIKNAITIAIAAIAGIGPIVLMVVGLFANGIANITKFVQMMRKFFARLKGDSSAFGYLAQKEAEAAQAAAGLSGATDGLTGKFLGQQKALERLIELLAIYSRSLGTVAGMAVPGAATAGGKTPVSGPMAVPVPTNRSFFSPMGRPKGYAEGVTQVPGTGNKDTVPALLTPGESVVTKEASQKYAPIIAAMNAGTIQAFAKGADSGKPFLPGVSGSSAEQFTPKQRQAVKAFYASVAGMAGAATKAAEILAKSTTPLAGSNKFSTGFIQQMKAAGFVPVQLPPASTSPTKLVGAHTTDKITGRKLTSKLDASGPRGAEMKAIEKMFPGSTYGVSKLVANLPDKLNYALSRGGASIKDFRMGWNLGGKDKLLPAASSIDKTIGGDAGAVKALRDLETEIRKRTVAIARANGEQKITDAHLAQATREASTALENKADRTAAETRALKAVQGAAAQVGQVRQNVKAADVRSGLAAGVLTQRGTNVVVNPNLANLPTDTGNKETDRLRQKALRVGLVPGSDVARESASKPGMFRGTNMGTYAVPTDAAQREYQDRLAKVAATAQATGRKIPENLAASIAAGTPAVVSAVQAQTTAVTAAMAAGGNAGIGANSPSRAAKQTVGFYLQGAQLASDQAKPQMYQKGYQMFDAFGRGGTAGTKTSLDAIPGIAKGTVAELRSILNTTVPGPIIQPPVMKGAGLNDQARMSTRELASALRATLGDAKTQLVSAFRVIPQFASQVLVSIQPIFAKLGQIFLQLNPWIGKLAQSVQHFFTQVSYTFMGLRIKGTELMQKARSAFETAMLQTMFAWDKVKGLPAKAKGVYETAMLNTMMAWDSVKRMPAKMTNSISTFMSDFPKTMQRLKNQVFYRGQDLVGRLKERVAPIREAATRGAGIAMNPVPRAIAIATAGMAAQEKLNAAVARASQAFDPLRTGIDKAYQSISAGAQRISNVVQLLSDPLGRAVVVATAHRVALQKLNAALSIVRQKLSPIGTAFNSVVSAVKGTAVKISRITQLLMDPLGRAVVISTLSKKMQQAFSDAVTSVRAGATRLYESLLWGAAKSIIGFENAVSAIKNGLTTAFNTTVSGIKAGATRVYESLLWGAAKAVMGLEGAINTIKTKTATKWNEVLAAFRGANLKQAFNDAWKSIKGAASTGAENIKSSLMSAGRSIADAGRIAGSMVVGAGAAVGSVAKGVGGWLGQVNEKTGQTRGQRMSGATNSAVMGLMGLSMAASFAGGEVGEMAQKIMPVTMGLMGLQMILPMLKSPFGLAIIAVTALTAMYVKSRQSLDELARSAAEAGANLGGISNRQGEISAATGYTFAGDRAKDNLFRLDTESKESLSKFSEYFESERGTKFLDKLRKLSAGERYKEVGNMITMAIADGMDEKTAKEYGYSIAYYLNDAVMQQQLKIDFAAGNFTKGIERVIDIIEQRQAALDATGGFRPVEVGQSSASRGLAGMTGIGQYDTQKSMFAEGAAKTGAGALIGTGIGAAAGIGAGAALIGGVSIGGIAIAGMTLGSVLPIVGTAIGAVVGTLVGGLIAWKQYNDQVARLNENVGSAAMTMGNAMQVIGELQGAEQLLLEQRRDGTITAKEHADQLARVREIEARAQGNMRSVIESMMMGGQVDTGALQQAMKNQLIFADFEEGLAGAISSTITPENIAKSLFPGNTLEEVFADVGKRAAVTEVMLQSLGGITPDNAKQRLSDITTQWATIAQDLIVAAEDGLTPDEARAILAGKRAGQIIMDALITGAEGAVENAPLPGTPADYVSARDVGAKAIAGEKQNLPMGTTVEAEGDTATVTQGGRQYNVTKKRDIADRIMENTPGATDTVDINNELLKGMFGDLEFSDSDRENFKATSTKLGYGNANMSNLFIDQMSNKDNAYGQIFRDNIESELAKAAEDANYDLTAIFGGLGLGETSDAIRISLQTALDTAAANLESPYLVTDMGIEGQARATAAGQAYTDYAGTRTDVSAQEAEVGLAAATATLGIDGLENITEDTEKLQVFFDLLSKLNSPEFAGMDIGQAISEVFGKDASADVDSLTQNLLNFDDAYAGVGDAFGENSQKVIDYFKETAAASKDSGETVEQYVSRQVEAAKGYAEVIKGMPTDMTTRLGIDVGDPSTYMEMGPYLNQVIEMWPILSQLDPKIDLKAAIEAGLLVDDNGEPVDPKTLVGKVRDLNKFWKDFGKLKDINAKKKMITDFSVENQGMSPEDAEAVWTGLIDQFGEQKIANMPTDVFRQAYQIQAAIVADKAELKKMKDAYAAMPYSWMSSPAGVEAWKAIQAMETAVATGEANLAGLEVKPFDNNGNTGSTGSSGSGSGTKPLAGQLKDSLKAIQQTTAGFMKMMNQNKGAFKNFVAGPFAPEFIEYLKGQGEEGLKVLKGGLEKMKEAYKLYIKEQLALATQAAKLMPMTMASMRTNAASQQRARKELAGAGIVGDEAQSAVLEQLGTGTVNLAMKALTKKRRGKELTPEEKEALKIWAMATNKAVTKEAQGMLLDSVKFELDAATLSSQYAGLGLPPEVAQRFAELGISVEDFNSGLQNSNSFVSKLYKNLMMLNAANVLGELRGQIEGIKTSLSFMSMPGVSAGVAQILADAGYSAEDLAVALAGGNDALLKIYNNAVRLQKLQAFQNIGNQVRETIQSAQIYKNIVTATSGMAGVTPELQQELASLGVTADMTAEEIKIYANALMAANVAQENAKTGTQQTQEALDAWISTYQRAQEALNRKEIRPQEKLIEGYQTAIKGFEAEIKALQVLQKPFQDQIKQLEKEISPLEKQIKALQKMQEPLQDDIENLQKQEEAITEQYEKRTKALEEVDRINKQIADRERAQLNIASAMAQGDIYAATQAAMEAKQQDAQAAQEESRRILEEEFENRRSAILDEIKAKEDEIKSIQEQIDSIQDSIEGKQEIIEGHRERIAEYDEAIAGWQEKISAENDKIATANDKIEASKKRQAELEERIYQAQLLQSMITQQAAITEAMGRGAWDEVRILAGGQRANLEIADAMGPNGFAELAKQTGMDITKMLNDFRNAVKIEQVEADIASTAATLSGAVAAANTVTDAAARTAGAGADIATTSENFEKSFRTSLENLGNSVKGFVSPENGLPKTLGDALTGLGSNLTTVFNGFIDKMTTTLNGITLNFERVTFTATGRLGKNEVKVDLSGKPGPAKVSPSLNADEYKLFAGGIVSGNGSRDSVSALVTPGEAVIRKSMVDKYGEGLFKSINQGSFYMPKYGPGKAMTITAPPSQTITTNDISPVYNNYSVNVSVSGANVSADEIANKAIMKIKQIQGSQIRSGRGY